MTKEHGKILEHLGVDRVVFPEEEVARQLADKMTWPNVLDFLPIDPEHSVAEVAMPGALSGKTLAEANLRSTIGVHVMGIKDVLSGKLDIVRGRAAAVLPAGRQLGARWSPPGAGCVAAGRRRCASCAPCGVPVAHQLCASCAPAGRRRATAGHTLAGCDGGGPTHMMTRT